VAGQLGITIDTHNHILAPNPFIYKVHNKATPQYQQAVGLALGHRLAHQPYSSMRMVLNSSGLRINRTTRPGGRRWNDHRIHLKDWYLLWRR
jgi:hypothetical protein